MERIVREYVDGLLIKETVETDESITAVEIDKDATAYQVIKSEAPKRFTLGVAYAANKIDVGKGMDQHQDFASPEALEECAWGYLRKGAQIGMFHAEGTYGHAEVVESYIYRGPDWEIRQSDGTSCVIKAGDWMLGAIWDEYGYDLVMKEMINGWSPQGKGVRRTPTPEALATARSRSRNGS